MQHIPSATDQFPTPFIDALRQKDTTTENGMMTNTTSLDACTDLFFTIGAMRGQDVERLCQNVIRAWGEDIQTALRILFWARDVRGGAGERQVFKDAVNYLIAHDIQGSLKKNIHLIPVYGRRDDLEAFFDTPYQQEALACIQAGLNEEDGLCAKWMRRRGNNFHLVRKHMQLSSSAYRKKLVELTTAVETQMALGNRSEIEYGKLPSVAAARYQKAFMKHDAERYNMYKEGLQEGTEKINAGAVYPYDVIKSMYHGEQDVAEAQWAALPNYMEGSTRKILPMCDVSGSMEDEDLGNNLTALDVCLSLGLYISERNEGPFKDAFMTFSGSPTLQYLQGPLRSRLAQLQKTERAMNTDLEAAFRFILKQAQQQNIKTEDMPTDILILSDMEFDRATREDENDYMTDISNKTAHEMITQQYAQAGYKLPNIIYWNLASRHANIPVTFDTPGTALISGFSPAILKSILAGGEMTPAGIMHQQINSERYQPIVA